MKKKKTSIEDPKTQAWGLKFLTAAQLLIVAVGFGAYANSFDGKFLYDDRFLIVNNKNVQDLSLIKEYFTHDIAVGQGKVSNVFRPLQMVSYSFNYAFGKLDVRGYHVTNTVLHILVAICVFWLLAFLFHDRFLSLVTALLFVVHPIHTEAVSYISGRADSLASFLMLLSMIAYVKWLSGQQPHGKGLTLCLLSYAGALLSKEYTIILPLVILFYHCVFQRRINPSAFACLLGTSILYILYRMTVLRVAFFTPEGTDTVFDRLPGFFVALVNYVRLLVLPFGQHMDYGSKLFEWSQPAAILGLILAVSIILFGYFQRKNQVILFSLGWFFLFLLPVSNLYKINAYMAEHFLYLPSIGFFLVVSYYLNRLYMNSGHQITAIVLVAAAVVFFFTLTVLQNRYWRNPGTFYEMTLKNAPDSANAYNNLGELTEEQGDLTKALMYINKSIALNPDNNSSAYYNCGSILSKMGKYRQAEDCYSKTIALQPNRPELYNTRGITYFHQGDYDLAIADFDKAIELDADSYEYYNNRGAAYESKGNSVKAIADYSKAIDLNGNYSEAYHNRGNVFVREGQLDEAIADFTNAVNTDPHYVQAYFDRGNAYGNKGDYQAAMEDFNKTIELDPNDGQAYVNRALVYYIRKEYSKAWQEIAQAKKLKAQINPRLLEDLKQASGGDPGLF